MGETSPEAVVLENSQIFSPKRVNAIQALQSLLSAMYFSLEPYLLQTQTQSATSGSGQQVTNESSTARPILSSSETTLTKPVMSSNGRIAVIVSLGLELLILITLACYIYSTPTWSPALDALAVLRMGSSVSNLPALGLMIEYQSEELQREDGLIGIVDDWEREKAW